MKHKLHTKTVSVLRSSYFFYATMAAFAFQAIWIALSGLYPQAFDENTHLSVIQLYSHRLLPFWSQQPAGSAAFGAVSRDPSYMYQYLSSFVYRFLVLFVHNQTTQVIVLRFISIILFGAGIVLFRRVLLNTKATKTLVNFVLAVFVLTPVVPFLAAQINYDNLLFPVISISLLLTQKLISKLDVDKTLDIKVLLLLAITCMFGAVVKYAFLPIFLAIIIFVGVKLITFMRINGFKKVQFQVIHSFQKLKLIDRVLLIGFAILLFGLCFERYGINTMRYGTPTPECDQVLTINRCKDNGSWLRNYQIYQDKINGRLIPVSKNPINFTVKLWMKPLSNNLFYALSGSSTNFKFGNPLTITRVLSVLSIGIGMLLFLIWQKQLRQKFKLNFLILVLLIYVLVLWSQNYADFAHLGLAVAIQGRYLVPILPIFYLLLGLGYARLFRAWQSLKAIAAMAVILILATQGGGFGIYIIRSDPSWYWPNQTVIKVNEAMRRALTRVTIGH